MTPSPRTTAPWIMVAAVIAVGLSLRGPIVAVSPVLDEIQRDLQATPAMAGLLTTVPVLCFAAVAPLVPAVTRKLGVNLLILLSLVLLIAGMTIRPWAGFALMIAATIVIGAAIGVGNVLLPVIVRRDFPDRPGPMMSASTTAMIVSATIPASLTAPIASLIGWQWALTFWTSLVLAAVVIWVLATGGGLSTPPNRPSGVASGPIPVEPATPEPVAAPWDGEDDAVQPVRARHPRTDVWRSWPAWELGIFFGLQSLLFYATIAWLPTMLTSEAGFDSSAAGAALSLVNLLGIAGAVAVPLMIQRPAGRHGTAALLAALWIALFTGLLWAPQLWPLWCVLGGFGQGGGLAISLSLIAMRSSGDGAARRVSATVQTVGYCLGAVGPVLIGGIVALTGGWTVPFLLLIGVSAVWGVLSARAVSDAEIA